MNGVSLDRTTWFSEGCFEDHVLVRPWGGDLVPIAPSRIVDTRTGVGGRAGPIGSNQAAVFRVSGVGGVPSTGVAAVVANVTVTGPTAAGYLTVYPADVPRPLASNLNYIQGQTVPSMVMVPVSPTGRVKFAAGGVGTHLVADLLGSSGTSPA